jgi:hypothetical protein
MSRKTSLVALALAVALAAPIAAQDAASKGAMGTVAKATVTATVVKVDSAKRILSLKDEKGEVTDVSVSPAVKRFGEIKVGDRLAITYMEALIISLAKADSATPLGSSVEQSVEPKKGDKPAGVATSRVKATVAVDSIDLAKRRITVHSADGEKHTFRIENPKNAEGVKAGDKITVVYEEAVAVEITSP